MQVPKTNSYKGLWNKVVLIPYSQENSKKTSLSKICQAQCSLKTVKSMVIRCNKKCIQVLKCDMNLGL